MGIFPLISALFGVFVNFRHDEVEHRDEESVREERARARREERDLKIP